LRQQLRQVALERVPRRVREPGLAAQVLADGGLQPLDELVVAGEEEVLAVREGVKWMTRSSSMAQATTEPLCRTMVVN